MDDLRDPLDRAVDEAVAALRRVGRIAEERDELDLLIVIDLTTSDLMLAWERVE